MINEDRKKLYDALSSEYDLGTYEEFERNIGDSVKRRKLYDAASADYDLGDFESYSQRIGPTHKESLDAFTAEHGSWLNDFEARDSAETNMSKAGMNSGIYVPSESAITGEERKRYLELHKQEEALKKAWFTSDEYLAQKDADALFLSDARNGLNKQIMEYSQSNPVLKPEGAFQINPYATRGAEADTELEKYRTASRILDDAINMHNAPSKYDGANVWQNIGKFGKGAADTLSDVDFWSMGLTEIADNLGVRDVLSTVQEKLGNLNDLSEESIENILSPAEKAVLQAWAINTQEQLKRKDDLSRGYQAGKGAAESLGFMAEFALTGGIGKAATEGVEQMAKWLGKKALTKVGGMTDDVAAKVLKETGEKIAQSTVGKYGVGLAESLAEAAGRTGVMPSTFRNISEKAAEIETDENGNNYLVKMNDAFAKGYVDSFIENLSEGGRVNALGGLIGDVAGKIPAYKRMVDKFSHTKASELWDAFNSSGVMNTLRAGGWHGLGEEYLEEWYGNALRTLTGVDKEALKDFATVDNQIITLTSFLPMTIFGGTVSTAQVLSANKDLEKKAEALKSALMERGYDEAQANNMIDMMRGAAPAEVSETLTPIVNSVANRNINEAAALMKPVGEFAAAVQRWQSFNTKYNYQEQEQRDGLRTQMEETLGQFWQQDENGRQTVQRGVNEKGEVVYMLGKPSAEDVEAGVTPKVAAVTSDGRKVFVNPSEYQLEDELEMNVFLGNEIMAEKGNKEQARMIEEKEAKIAAIREAAVPGTAINIGTAEAPVQVIVIQRNPDGVIVNTSDGQTRQMTYEEFGNYVGVNAVPMTDAQIDEQEADALAADRAQREAALDQEYDNDDAALEELAEAEDEIEQAVDSNIPLPMKADGSVDQNALWNENPERWAQWNDEQRKDGGANTLAYVGGAIAKEQAKIAELQAAYAAESDFDARDAIEKQIADTQARVERLTAIQQGYVAQAEAAAAPVVEAEPVAPRVASQMSEQEKAAMDAQHQARLDAARSITAKREAMQNYVNEISQGSVPMTLISMDEYEQVMKDAGCSPNQITQVQFALEEAKNNGVSVPAFFVPRVGIFAFVENIPNIEQLRLTYIHERQHRFTSANSLYLNAILQLNLSHERLAEIVAALAGTHFYDKFDYITLADEVISYAMERAYTYEDFSVALQELGIEQEIIDIITEIDNEQRSDNTTYSSRRGGRYDLHDYSSKQGNRAKNDRNSEAVSGGLLGSQGNRSIPSSRRGTEGGEGAEVTPEGPSFRITPEMDADYRNAIEQGDEEIAQQMVYAAAEEWAKDSKVRDEYGNLAVQFHGSRDFGFTVFNTDPKTQNLGSHFGTEEAARVFDYKGDKTYRVYLNITNPWHPRYEDFWTDQDQTYAAAVADLANELAQAGNEEAAKIYAEIVAKYPMARDEDAFVDWLQSDNRGDTYKGAEDLHPKLRRLLEIGGYDGVQYNNWVEDPGHDSWVALYPEQIKSAEAATFDDDNKLVPLSERFTEGVDLRFRTAATNPEVNLTDETRKELADKGLVMEGGAIMSEDYAALKQALGYETPLERNTDLDQVRFSIGTKGAHIANYRKHPDFEERVVEILERLAERMAMNELVYGVVSTATKHTYGKKLPGSVAGPLRSNQEYIITFDLDTSCPRTFQYLNLVKKIEKRIGRPLTQVESIQLIEIMRMYGQQIPCVYCYAENKRQALKQYYTDFMEARHGVLSAATDEEALKYMYGHTKDQSNDPKKALTEAAYNVFVEWRKNPKAMYNPTIRMVWNQYTNDRNSILTLLDTMLADKGISVDATDAKIAASVAAEFGVTNAKAKKVIEEIVAEWKWDVIEGKEHDQYTPVDEDDWGVNEKALEVWRDMTAYAKSASSAKSVIRYTPYTDELKSISQEDKDYINGMGGVRMHSSNDFRIDYVFDYFQFMADMALYKMFGHTYTKSPEFVRIFGNSGYKINMSIAAYQDENGKIRPNADEGFDWEEAKTLRQLFPNAGTMLMATSDEQIQMALDSDWIDMCIPFHHSGLPKAVWYNMRMWQDYTTIQKELFLNSSEMKAALKADGVEIPKKAKADVIAQLYNDHFGIEVLYDKKGKRIRPHFLPGPTIVDGHKIPGHNNDHQTYLDLCKKYGVKPRFAGMQVRDNSPEGGGRLIDVTEHPRYMIFIKETSRTDSPQTPIQFNFDQPSEALGGKTPIDYAFDELEARAMAESELEGKEVSDIYNSLKKDQYGIVDHFIDTIIKHKEETGEDYPLDYLTPESREWFLVQRKALEEAFKDVETIPYHRNEYDEQGNLTKGEGLGDTSVVDVVEAAENDLMMRIIGEQAAQRLDNANKATTMMDNLAVAREMEEAGKDAKAIKLATGWERAADTKWRYEQPDLVIKAKHGRQKNFQLKRLIEDSTLFTEYPILKDVKVIYEPLPMGDRGFVKYVDGKPEIHINVDAYMEQNPVILKAINDFVKRHKDIADVLGEKRDLAALSPEQKKLVMEEIGKVFIANNPYTDKVGGRDILVHEIQHIIQHEEGFAQGGSDKMLDTTNPQTRAMVDYMRKEVDQLTAELYDNFNKRMDLRREASEAVKRGDKEAEQRANDERLRLHMEFNRMTKRVAFLEDRLGKVKRLGIEGYKSLAGEVEARKVASRLMDSAEERRNTLLSETEDVAREDQIFLLDNVMMKADEYMATQGVSFRITPRTDEQREQLFDAAKAHYGLTNNFNASGYMLPDGSLLDFSEANDGGDPNRRSLDHRDIEGLIMDEGKEYDSRYHYVVDFVDEGAIRMLPEAAGFQLSVPPTAEQRSRLMDYIYKHNGEVIMEITDENGSPRVYMEYNRRTSPSRIFSDMDRFFNEGVVPGIPPLRFRIANDNQAIFVSNAAKAVEGIKQEKATPEQWLKMIEKNGGLKAGEDKWMGLSDWLKASDKKTLTKQEVLDFINENMIVIEEQHYSENGMTDDEMFEEYIQSEEGMDHINYQFSIDAADFAREQLEDQDLSDEEYEEELSRLEAEYYEDDLYGTNYDLAKAKVREEWEEQGKKGVREGERMINETRLDLTTEGLENNHEIALVVPTVESYEGSLPDVHFFDAGEGRAVAWIRFGETSMYDRKDNVYKHVLVIDEIQSQRHQDAREKGYTQKKEAEEYSARMNEKYGTTLYGWQTKATPEEYAEYVSLIGALTKGVPAAPFEKNWHELAMKRMLRYAAENDFDAIAWTKGDQQAARYEIGNSVDEIKSIKEDDNRIVEISLNDGDTVDLVVDAEGKVVSGGYGPGSTISDVVGKEIAEKLMAEDNVTLSGEGLRIGGEGMRGFYDKMLPSFMNKYGKKWGVKVEDINLPNLEDGLTMHSVPVTDEMKASVLEGQVMFRTIPITQEVQDEMDAISATAIVRGNYLKAPNGADTNLTPEQWAMVRTKYFLNWFGDWINDPANASKVVDENGEPKVVYHGRGREFNTFEHQDYAYENAAGRGFYFTDDPKAAELYTMSGFMDNQDKMQEALYGILYSEYKIDSDEAWELASEYIDRGEADFEQIDEAYKKAVEMLFPNPNVLPVFLNIRRPYDIVKENAERDSWTINKEIEKNNLDGVIDEDFSEAYKVMFSNLSPEYQASEKFAQYMVVNASQIKSATDNTGEFSEENDDIRFRTSLELDEEFGDAWRNQQNEDGRHSTQVANTKSTYEKIGRYLEDAGMKGASILDASSGLGLGTQALREMGFQVDDVEPFPSENREAPTFSSYADIDGKYDVVISNAVLNVIPDDWRADVLHQMAAAVKEGGKMIINTRPASNIAQQGVEGKTRITLDSPSEILVKRGDRIAAYQKGFTSEELAEWIKSELGEGWRVEKATKKNSGISGEGTAVVIKESDDTRFRTIGTPTDEVVANGLQLTPAQAAEVAANIFAALPEESRKKITEGLNGNVLGLKDAILQIPASLASKENWNEEDKQMADVVAEEMTKMAGEMTRPFSAEEGLWLLYNNLNKGTDLISQASRALVQRNLGFDAETLAKQEQAKEDVRFRTVGDANSNAQASLYNRGAVNVWTRLKESFVDMQASVEELVKAIEKRTGKVAQGFENVLLALNQQSSKGLAAMESYTQKFLNPMFDEIRRIMDETKMKYEDVVRYVILKHGLERNKKLAQRDARAHYQEIYDDIISKITGMTAAQKRTYLTNAQLKEGDAKAELATLQAVDMSAMTDEEKREHKKKLAAARKAVEEAEEHLKRAQKIASLSEQEAQDELDKIFEKIENGTDSVYKEMRENDYSGISSMFYDQLGVDRKNFSTEEQYQAALMEAKKDRYSSLKDIEAAAEAEVKSFEGKTDTTVLWKRINAATKETLRQQYEANMISKDQYDSLRNMFEYYVPLRGFKDNTAEDMYTYYRKPNSTGYTKPILGAEGRKTEAESPFGWIAAMAGSAIASNVKNEAKLALYYFVSNRPENGIATISKTWFVDSGEVDERGKKIFRPAYPPFSEDLSSDAAKDAYEAWQENMRELQKKGQAYEAGQRLNLGNAVVNISDANKPEHIVNVKVGGKDYTIIINGNPRAAQAINGDLNIEGTAQDYSALFGPVLRWMSSVNTSYNPEFWITNMMRDMAFTMMAVNIKEDPAYRRKFKKNYLKAFKVISLVAKNENGTIGDSYLEQQYKDFVKYGGVTGYTQIKDSETWEHEIENYLSSTDPESLKSGKVMRGMKSAFHAAHRFGESLEQVSRFAAFLTARETGKSINEAINDAKEITVNFNRKGSGKMITLEEAKYLTGKNGQPLTKPQQWMVVGLSSIAPLGRRFIMFFNAAIQGLNATYKLMKKNPKRFTGWALGYAAVGMMNAVLHAMLDDDDDYLDIPQYERRNSLMIGGNGAYFKWALPQEARAFYALGDLAVETVMGRNPHQNFLGEALKIGTEVLPVNPSEGWKAFMPSVAIPFIELALNEDYKGAPIYNDQKWLSEEEKERTAKWSNAYQGTGWTYVKISQGLNFISGGDKHDAGLINLQPEKLEHLVQSAFGGTIRTADKFINTVSAAIDPDEPVTVRQFPFVNRFLTINDERFKNVHVNDVFDYYKADAEHALTLEKQYTKERDTDALVKLRSSDEYQWAKIYSKYKKPLKAIQDKIKVADGTAEKKELMKQQDELKKRMIKEISEL